MKNTISYSSTLSEEILFTEELQTACYYCYCDKGTQYRKVASIPGTCRRLQQALGISLPNSHRQCAMIATVTLWTATRYCKRYLLLRHVTIFNKLGIYLLGVTSHKAISEGKMRKTLQKRHPWTDEELKILSYLRRTCHWHFKQIQKSYFPSLSLSALRGAYWHQSTEDRIRRASNATIPIIDPRNSVKGFSSASKTHSISDNLSRSENSIEALASTPQSPVDRNKPFISNECNSSRYELRPNRPSNFPPRKPQYLVDRRRFPHFLRSYKYSLNRQGIPDSDYTPQSRMPTPSSSDRSVSIVSSFPSAASSLELFGLEVRSPRSSNSGSVTSDRPNDISSSEFFSSEEHPLPT